MTSPAAPRPAMPDPAPKHDPQRIRGAALRRSLFYTLFAWVFGAYWLNATNVNGAVSTQFLGALGAGDLFFGLLGAVPYLGALVQLPGTMATEALGRRRTIFFWGKTLERLMYVLLALAPWVLPPKTPASALAYVFVGLCFLAAGTGNFGSSAWHSWMADLVPQRVHGKFFAKRYRIGIAVATATGVGVGFLMDAAGGGAVAKAYASFVQHPWLPDFLAWRLERMGPLVCMISLIYFTAGVCGVIDIQLFHRVNEPPMRRAGSAGMRSILALPLRDREFRWYVAYWACFTCAIAFIGVFPWKHVLAMLRNSGGSSWWTSHPALATNVVLMIVVNVGQFLAYPIWGRLIDRFGRKPIIFISSMLHTVQLGTWVFLPPQYLVWAVPIGLLGGAVWGGQEIANFNMMLGFNRKGGPSYQAAAAVIANVAGATAAVLAGVFATVFDRFQLAAWEGHSFNRYHLLFAVGVLLKLVADLAILPRLHDPNAQGTRATIRYLMGSVYDYLNDLVTVPLRLLRSPRQPP